ncbi:hypothetical protein T4D_15314 [Trichinella pseudospiralis]|uniref:Uncharacterized protein n=1 Tax=Trichinella pseudospiralis TaxID=6337 RepID=A0A0V1FEK4_TRIPS|nr:hypothetical protein T4D_15314 [Trichinella pseudospiralis]
MSTNLSVVIAVALVYTIATLWLMESTIVVVEGQLALVLGHALTTGQPSYTDRWIYGFFCSSD